MSLKIFAKPKQIHRHSARPKLWFIALFILIGLAGSLRSVTAAVESVTILAPDNGAILDGIVTLQANVVSDTPVDSVVFFYDPHEDDEPEISLGPAAFNTTTGFWEMAWDTTTVADTFNDIDTDGDDVEDTTVNITKPPTHDGLRVVATSGASMAEDAIDIRIQNMLTVRFTLPDNQEDMRGFVDLEAILTSEFDITSVNFDVYDMSSADPDILTPFGEFESLGEPIENRHYGRPLGAPLFPTGFPLHPIGAAAPEGSQTKRWVIRGWDTTTIDDGTYLLVATAEDTGGRTATYMVETYIVNDLRVVITAPDDGDTVSRFVPLEARTSSLTGADNAAPGSLWPATAVEFTISNGADPDVVLSGTEIPAGSGRWRAVWDGDASAPGAYTITAEATNANPNGAEVVTDSIGVTLVAAGGDLEAFFPFDWSYCHLYQCSFLDGSGGGPTSWEWDFGDGNTSTEQNPVHSYVTYGVYEVSLTVSDGLTTDTHSRLIPVGNTGVVSFNRNDLDLESATEFIDWTSAFKNFDYTVGSTLAIPVMWETTVGNAQFNSMATTVCDADEATPNQECVIFTPEEADGTPPHSITPAESGVLFQIEFTDVQFRGITDIFKGKVNVRIVVDVDTDGNGSFDQTNQLGTNVDVTNDGLPDPILVAITSPLEGAQVGGIVPIEAATVSSVTADQIEFFVDGASIGVDSDGAPWTVNWDTTTYPDGAHQLSVVATGAGFASTSPVVNVIVANTPPTAVITSATCTGLECSFDGSGSSAPNGSIVDYTWTFLDGATLLGTRNGVTASFTFPGDGPYTARLTVTDNVGATDSAETMFSPTLKDTTFQVGFASDEVNQYLTFPYELCIPEEGEEDCVPGGPPPFTPLDASMEAVFSNIDVIAGGGVIGGDLLEFDVTITNTSPPGSGIVLSAYAFQSKVSESPALGSRVGDKAFYGQVVPGTLVSDADSPLVAVKKNGTSNGLFTGKWKGICINSSLDFIPEFNSGLEDETLECAGNRADTNADGEPELQTGDDMLGLRPGESQTIRIRIDSGTTDGALHVVEPGTLQGSVQGIPVVGPNGITYYDVQIDNTGIISPNVVSVVEFGDNKVLRDADGTFNPTFAPAADGYTFNNQIYLTLPRRSFAFSDIIGRNHTCDTYGLTLGACSGGGQPFLNFLDTGDLVPGVQNFAAILRGYGEFYDANGDFVPDINPDTGDVQPSYPYDVRCDNCGGLPYVPIAEFYKDNGDGTVTQQVVGGTYGDPVSQPYLTLIDSLTAEHVKQDIIPEPDPGGPCQGGERKPACAQLGTSAVGEFYDLTIVPGGGTNGGDAIEFSIDITNSSTNPEAYLTAFNYQTKSRGLADIGILDGYTQDRRDIRTAGLYDFTTNPTGLPACTGLDDFACWNAALGVGHFPNVIGNGLLFGQMVWKTDNDAGREGPVIPDQVYVDPVNGFDPVHYWLESVKKNGPFAPILKGNVNFICVKSGLFNNDPDSDAGCAGEPAILIDPNGEPVPSNIDTSAGPNQGRLGLPPGETQSVRIRMEFGDFRGAMLEIVAGTLTTDTVNTNFTSTLGLGRDFDCSDQRELEWCHPFNVGENIGYLPNTDATWLTPETLEEIEYVIINQPGDAPTVMNFQQNFGVILAMAGFIPSAEFYAPDPNEDLIGTPYEGILIQQQVLGEYSLTEPPAAAPLIMSAPETSGEAGSTYSYQVTAVGYPAPTFSLNTAPSGMTINSTSGLITWASPAPGQHDVAVLAQNSAGSDMQSFQVDIAGAQYGVVFSTNKDRSNPAALDGAIVEGDIYVYIDPDIDIKRVDFWIDDYSGNPDKKDSSAPFDLVGGNSSKANPLSTAGMANGPHTVYAELIFNDGSTTGLQATFTVDNPALADTLMFSTSPDRSNPTQLEGATVSGDIYVYLDQGSNVKLVKFWIDDSNSAKQDKSVPFDLMGGNASTANPWKTTLELNGAHTMTVQVSFKDGTVQEFETAFSIDNPWPVNTLVYSTSQDRSNPQPLDGAVVSNDIYIFIDPPTDVKQVQYWIDYYDGKPDKTNKKTPFDLMGGNATKAKPWWTNWVSNGAHTIYAVLTFNDGSAQLIYATFDVQN